jgi:hypothetical protein
MGLTTYTELKTSLTSWFHNRTDVADIADDLIDMAEAKFNRDIRTRRMDAVSPSLAITSGVATIPTGLLEVLSLRLTVEPYNIVDMQPIDVIEAHNPAVTELPSFFSLVGSQIITWPATTATARLRYRAKITPLSLTDPTNWILEDHPDLYLKAALAHASEYFVDDDRLTLWERQVEIMIARVNEQDRDQVGATIRPLPGGFAV